MMLANLVQCLTPLLSTFREEGSYFCMRIKDMTENRLTNRYAPGGILQGLCERSEDADVHPRTGAGSWKLHTPGSTDSENSWSDMRSSLKAMKHLSISPLRSSVGEKLLLFTDKH